MTRRTDALRARKSDTAPAPAPQDDVDLEEDLELDKDEIEDEALEEPESESSSDEYVGTSKAATKPQAKKRRSKAFSTATPDTSVEPLQQEKSTVDVITSLSNELLVNIFSFLDPQDAKVFGQISKRFHAISLDPFVVSSFFVRKYGTKQALYHLLGRPRLVTIPVLDQCFQQRAHLSRYLLQYLLTAYPTGLHVPHWISQFYPLFGKGHLLRIDSFTHLLRKGMELYGNEYMGLAGERDSARMSRAISNFAEEPTPADIEEQERLFEEMLQHGFVFFSDDDPLTRTIVAIMVYSDTLYARGKDMGVKITANLYAGLMFQRTEDLTHQQPHVTTDDYVKLMKTFEILDPDLKLRSTYITYMLDMMHHPEPFLRAVKQRHDEGELSFDAKADLLNKARSFTESGGFNNTSYVRCIFQMYPEEADLDAIFAIASSLFAPGDYAFDDSQERLEAWQAFAAEMTIGMLARLLLQPHLDTYAIIAFVRECFPAMDEPLQQAVLDSIFDEPDAGNCLKELCDTGFLKKTAVREALLARAVDLKTFKGSDEYPYTCTPLGASTAALARFAKDGVTWNESWKSPEVRKIQQVALPRATTQSDSVSYMAPYYGMPSLGEAVFDQFVRDRSVLDVLLQHAIINGNQTMCKILVARGATVTTLHFRLLSKVPRQSLGRPIMDAVLFTPYAEEPNQLSHLNTYPNDVAYDPHQLYATVNHAYTIDQDKPAVKRLEHLRAWKASLEELVKDVSKVLAAKRKNRVKGGPRITKTPCQKMFELMIKQIDNRVTLELGNVARENLSKDSKDNGKRKKKKVMSSSDDEDVKPDITPDSDED